MPSPPKKPALSGVVIACNEADRIGRCVASLMAVCREVIVLDSGSRDDTVAIARALGATVDYRAWDGYARQKNAAIARASQPWVLLLDADEWLEPPAQQALIELFAGEVEHADVWLILRRTHWLGTALQRGSAGCEPIERLFRQHLRHAEVPVHEYLDTRGQRVRRSPIRLEHATARSAAEYRRKLEGYARLWAEGRAARGKRGGRLRGLLAAAAYAIKHLLLRGGLLDGRAGWHYHREHIRYTARKYRLLAALSRHRD